ncbi:MAG: hypothetical protein K0R34_683 [Herbinix sp.]|jgi:hypothetical protein|nr:hypothetical protein [Herbinix sp.]
MAGIGDESIEMSKFGTALFAFGFVLVIGLGVFTIGKAITVDGSDKVQKQLDLVQQSEFSDYDQQAMFGTKVKAAYTNFEGKAYAVLVATRAMVDEDTPSDAEGIPADAHLIDVEDEAGDSVLVEGSDGLSDHPLWCVNYNAVLSVDSIQAKNGFFEATGPFATNAGQVDYYNTVANMKQQGMAEYIPSGARFQSSLIKDTTGQVVGILFQQIAAN